MVNLQQLLQITIERSASDLHIVPDYHPSIRINNELFAMQIAEVTTKEIAEQLLIPILTDEQKENLFSNKEIDFGYEALGFRFRVNVYFTKNRLGAAFRLIPTIIKTAEQLGLPSIFHEFSEFHQGLVLVCGPTGEGKSTTLASVINEINAKFSKHIVTIEDPIEFIYPPSRSIISQRELHQDTHSFSIALRSVLREDPDVILLGEMRDYDTIQAAITTAETGHLVFSTLHTSTAPETVNRIIDVFPAEQQNQVKSQLASSLKAVVSQRLVPNIDHTGRIAAFEIMLNNTAVSSVIRDGKTFLLDNIIQTSEGEKMMLFERNLAQLYKDGKITKETAFAYALRSNDIKKLIV